MADSKMIETAKTIREMFLQDKNDFVTEDVFFDDPFATGWLQLIDDAESFDTDETLDDVCSQLVVAEKEALNKCSKKFLDSKYYIEKAFPDDPTTWDAFGYDKYNHARNRILEMEQFMKTFHGMADKYKAELIAQGYSQPMIDEIKTTGKALEDASREVAAFVKSMPVKTAGRILKHNEVWKTVRMVCRLGKRIYIDDDARRGRYMLSKGRKKKRDDH